MALKIVSRTCGILDTREIHSFQAWNLIKPSWFPRSIPLMHWIWGTLNWIWTLKHLRKLRKQARLSCGILDTQEVHSFQAWNLIKPSWFPRSIPSTHWIWGTLNWIWTLKHLRKLRKHSRLSIINERNMAIFLSKRFFFLICGLS